MDKFGLLYETIQTEPMELTNAGLADRIAGLKTDLDIATDIENDDLLDDLVDDGGMYDDELDDDMIYAAEMVTVVEMPCKGKMYACVEASDIFKFLKANDLEVGDIASAIAQIASANGIEVNNIAIVNESNQALKALLREAKLNKGGKALDLLDKFASIARNAKNKGITVLKKKSKKK